MSLAATTVTLHGNREALGELASALRSGDVGRVLINDEAAATDLAVIITGSAGLARRYAISGTTVLPVHVTNDTVTLGPVLDEDSELCYECARAGHGSQDVISSVHSGLIVREIIALVAKTPRESTVVSSVRHDLENWTTERFMPVPRAGCAWCPPLSDATAPLALRYEYSVSRKPARWEVSGERRSAASPRARSWPSASLLPLPTVPSVRRDQNALSRNEIAVLAARVAGRSGDVRRWAPSCGNLGMPLLYLAVRGGDVPDGLYGYDVSAHALALLSNDISPAPLADEDAAVLVLTADLGRGTERYGAAALKLGALDTGVALAQLDYVASALRRQVTVVNDAGAATRLASALYIDETREPVTAVVRLR